MKKIFIMMLAILASLIGVTQPYIQGSIHQGAASNKADITFLPDYNSAASEYTSYLSISVAIPSASATGVTPTIASTGIFTGVVFVQATPFSYTSGSEKIFSWICNNLTVTSMAWTNGGQFTGATITFNGGSGISKIRLVDFSNNFGGTNGNTLFSVVTNVPPFDVTNYSDFFYAISGANGSTKGNYPNGDFYVETNVPIGMAPCNPSPNAGTVNGTSPLCIGGTSTYTSNGDAGGTWSSGNTGIATVNSLTGSVTAVTAGTTDITYTVTGCSGNVSSFRTLTVNANVSSGEVSGTSPLCIGGTATFFSTGDAGGTWSSANTAVATINATTGAVTAVGAGTTDITYTVNSGCGSPLSSFVTLTVNAGVNAGTVSGTSPLCIGGATTYTSNGTAGGTWSSGNSGIATVNATTGAVTAVGAGTTNITYTVNSGCGSPVSSFASLTVNANVSAGTVTGTSPLCIGGTATYTSNGTSGGSWSSGNTGIATINTSTGVVTAAGAGTTNITYTVNSGCGSPVSSFKTLTVNANVSAGTVNGTTPLIIGGTATYTSNGTAGGSWSSGNTGIATINSTTGAVSAVSAGTTNITYTVNSGCGAPVSTFRTLTVTVQPFIQGSIQKGVVANTVDITFLPNYTGAAGEYLSYTSISIAIPSASATGVAPAITGTGNLSGVVFVQATPFSYTNGSEKIFSWICNNLTVTSMSWTNGVSFTGATVTLNGGAGTSKIRLVDFTNLGGGTNGNTLFSVVTSVSPFDVTNFSDFFYAIGGANGSTEGTYGNADQYVETNQLINLGACNPSPNAGTVSGASPLCIGGTSTYTSNGDVGGTWSSTNTSVATVNVTTGAVTAIAAGATDITYTVTGCSGNVSSFRTLTVNANVSAGTVSGTSPLCIGGTATYTSNGTAGGTWSSTNTSVATVNATTGVVTAVGSGTTDITYTVNSGCGSPVSSFKTLTVPPNVTAGTVSGTSPLCIGATAIYASNGTAGGSWSSTNTSVATVNAGTGIVTAVAAGTTDITYTVSSGCGSPVSSFKTLTVSPNVSAGTISGTSPLCIGAIATYTSSGTAGGSWSSTNILVATVNAGTGVVTAVAAGTTDITYTVSSGCGSPVSSFKTLTVSPNVLAGTVSGASPLCIGATATYTSNGTAGGSWSSTNILVATVNASTGVVTAVAAGTTDITYTVSSGCGSPVSSFKTLTVSPNVLAGTVSGASPLCIGATATYASNGTAGGSWSSTNILVATVNASTGVVTAVAAGTTDITYTVSSGCGSPVSSFKTLTVSPNVAAGTVSGTSPLCIGGTATYTSNGTAGGTWSSTNTSVATVNASTGIVTAVAAGTTDITYTVSSGCGSPVSSFKTLTVSPNVSAGTVSGTSPLCIGGTTTYTNNGTAGGTWSSTNTGVATVNATTGAVTAVSAGTSNITYTVSSGCGSPVSSFKTLIVSPNVSAGTVSGTSPLCIGATATYTSNGTAGGSWSSTNILVATVNAGTGVVTAVAAGTTDITYTVSSGCGSPVSSFKTLTVSPNVSAGTVSGASPLCIGGTATYTSNGTAGGTWSSTNISIATVNSSTGLVSAVAAGTTDITYTVSSGCGSPVSSFKTLTVSPNVAAGTVSGTSPLCIGGTTTYTSNGTAGGTWSSTNTSVATVNAGTGVVTAVAAGTTDITYTVSSGCGSPVSSFKTLTVSANVSAGTVSGTSPLCIGGTATYTSNGTAGGSWSSTNTSVATVNAGTGVVTAVAAGTTDITYTVSSGCGSPVSSFKTLTVSPNVAAGTVSGTSPLTVGATATYTSNGTTGGTWTSTNTSVATVNSSTGLVSAVAAGTTNITYTVSTGCGSPVSSFKTLTVNAPTNAGIVSGTSPLCIGATATYTSNGDPGGSWSSTNTSVATVNASTGLVTALSAGTTDITYTVNSVSAFKTLTVSPNVSAGTVSGTSPLCIGGTATYTSNGTAGGSWSSTNTSVATVNVSTGVVTAVGAGTTNITYTVNSGCGSPVSSFATLTVNANVSAGTVSGTSPLCIGGTATYSSNGTAGGTWSSTNTSVATVNTTTGAVTAVGAGTTNITYTVNSGCGSPVSSFATLTVNANVSAGTVSGTSPLCIGGTATYSSNGTAGGTWSSTNTSVATVNATTGMVTAAGAGTTNITYTVSSGCGSPVSSFATLTVNANVSAGTVSGTSPLCIGGTATYTSSGTAGGTWSSTNTSVATVNAGTGVVTAVTAGTTDITYTVSSGCGSPVSSFRTLTVSPNVSAGTVSGTSPLCIGGTATYITTGDAGGSWSSTNTSVATVNATTGAVAAVGAGTTNITYTVNSGCGSPVSSFATLIVNANVSAGTVSGTSSLCIGSTATYTSNGTAGGTWSSTNTSVATVNATTGAVIAVAAGTTNITYTVSSGCGSPVSSSATLTVNANVSAGTVNGTSPLCIGGTTTYTSNGTAGGTWSSGNTGIATVNATTGAVIAVTAGTTNITYTVNSGCGNPVSSFKALTVNANVSAGTVSGTTLLIVGSTATYTSNGTAGGTWSSGNSGIATVNASTGSVTAVSAGTTNITYTVNSGCGAPVSSFSTLTVTDHPYIQGSIKQGISANTVDIAYLPNFTSAAGEYLSYVSISVTIPSSSAIGVTPTITGTGNLAGVVFVPATPFSYTNGGETIYSWICNNLTETTMSWTNGVSFTGATITFNGGTGTSKVRLVDFTNIGGGTNGNTLFSVVTNVSPFDVTNFADFFYAISGANGSTEGTYGNADQFVETNLVINLAGCNTSPNAGTVSGTSPLCIGGTATYTSNGDAGGTWSSGNTGIATVNSSTGAVNAVAAGTTDITYTVTGCSGNVNSFATLTVNGNVSAGTVSGSSPLCIGGTATYSSNGNAGGTWSSTNISVATVNATTGAVIAAGAGTTNITYTVNNGCGSPVSSFAALTVNANVSVGTVSGTSPLCIGGTATYTSNGTAGGTWSSGNTGIAAVNATTGAVIAVTAGTTNITYTVNSGCGSPVSSFKTLTVTANVSAGTVSGTTPLIIGNIATYTSNGTAGGTWSSGNSGIATVNASTGSVTAVSTGTTDITYTVNSGCGAPVSSFSTLTVTDHPYIQGSIQQGPSANSVNITFLPNYTSAVGEYLEYVSISVAIPSSSATGVTPTIAGTGNLAGIVFVPATPFSYTNGGETIYSWICNNLTETTMSWTNAVSFTGATITFNGGTGTSKVRLVDFTNIGGGTNGNTLFSVVTNVSPFEVTNFADFFYAISGANGSTEGTYGNADQFVETNQLINLAACNASPNAGTVSGTSPLCISGTATYTSNGDAGGTWSSGNTGIAIVDATTGAINAVAAGTTDIVYTVPGCTPASSFKTLTVNANVSAGEVSGTSPLCIGATATYSSTGTTGGLWSSSDPSVATVNATTGEVTAIATGTTNITYTVNSGCGSPVSSFATLTVDANVSAGIVSGTSPLCIGGTATYSSTGTAGGTWSSTNTSVATVNATTGAVTAVGAGTTNITYTVNSGCGSPVSSFATLTVNANVSGGTVSGTSPLCIGGTATYSSNGTAGGTWSSTNTSVATVNATSGAVTAVGAGTTDITYTVNSGCGSPVSSFATLTVSVNVSAGTVSGVSPLCIGGTATYTSNGTAGGTWSSTNTGVATVNATTGEVTATGDGTTDIIYTVTGCGGPVSASQTLTVNANVSAGTVSGASPLCIGGTATYSSNGTAGGTWSSTNTSVATVNATTGAVTAVGAGATNITYTVKSGCGSPSSSFATLTVNANVSAGTVSGATPLIIGGTTTYTSNGTAGGSWSSGNTGIATVNSSTGLVSALSAGTTDITYTVNSGCGSPVSSFRTLTVNLVAGITVTCPGNITKTTTGCSKSIATSNPVYTGPVVSLTWVMTGATTGSSAATGINFVGTRTFNAGVTTVTYTVKDAAANTATCSFTITVTESTPPGINCPSNIIQNAATGVCSKTITLINPSVSDNCAVKTLTWVMNGATSGASSATGINYVGTQTFNVGTTTITYTAKDASGNTSTCSFTVKVVDNQDPTIICPSDITTAVVTGCNKNITVPDPIYGDNCGVTNLSWIMIGATNAISPFTGINLVGTRNFNVGVTLVTYIIMDASGNIRICSFTVTVTDNINPTITCPADITQNTSSNSCSKSVSTPNPVFSDNCSVTKLTWVLSGATTGSSSSGGINYVGTRTFNKGVTTVTYTAKDASGNTATCSFIVTVADNTNPTISCPGNITQNAGGSNCSKSVNTSNPSFNDNCGVTTLTWVMSGATTGSSPATGINYVGTRAFYVGATTITYTAKDAAGNTASCSFTVNINGSGNCNLKAGEPVTTTHPGVITENKISVKAFPNPAENYFNLKITTDRKEEVEIRVMDIAGKQLQFRKGSPDKVYRLGDGLMQGTYIVEVRQGGERVTTKVIKL